MMTETANEDHQETSQESPNRLDVPKVVELEHPFFSSIEGTHFRIRNNEEDMVMVMPLETGTVELKAKGIIQELGLSEKSPDIYMLGIIAEALAFVQGIAIGDPIPSEMHSGQASWSITDAHRATALARLSAQLMHWLSGDDDVHIGPDLLEKISSDPTMKVKVNEAFGEAAERLGLGRDQREEVVSIVNGLSEELAYIEALRSDLEQFALIEDRIVELAKIYNSEKTITDTIIAITRLIAIALTDFRNTFIELDDRTSKIMDVLQNVAGQVKYIRSQRDTLHRRFWAWHELVEKWKLQPAMHSPAAEKLLQETYHFLAQRFLPQQEWDLFFKKLDRKKGRSSEKVW